ncbi:Uma2 family endonuclease [Nodosilinea sp. E11]|uniref:Uma2 family endonuclease n=1 Tax=Nodosilinea sp. E11 TaxID=3037479 RepID=UPI002934840D|nr:Uma2 family endonuclease [Nodosilinea sp. E11]WOD40342.1 Uma2 family endonuclease [Nodosilinea sp. E11]
MVSTTPTSQPIATDQWVSIQWAEYLHILEDPALEEARCYFDSGYMRLEMAPLGPLHGRENSIISTLVVLFATLRGLRMVELTNTTIRKTGLQDAQPDIAFYVGQGFDLPPRDNRPIDVLTHGAPQLVIEIASTTLNDDLGKKRLLYERLGSAEYWVVDVQAAQVIAFEIAERRSGQVDESRVLPGLAMTTLEMALERSQREDDATITRWLLELFSQNTQEG